MKAALLLLAITAGCKQPGQKEVPAHLPAPEVVPTSERVRKDAAPAATQDAGQANADWELRNSGLRGIGPGTIVSETLARHQFPECIADWRREKGRAAPHVEVSCPEGQKILLVFSNEGQEARIESVRVLRAGITAPSGLAVGSSLEALMNLTPNLTCRGEPMSGVKDGVIYRPHSLCTDPRFPNVAYVFRGVVFESVNPPAGGGGLRIDALEWRP